MTDEDADAPGIAAVGAYAPRLRVSADEFEAAWGRFDAAGVESKAVPDADEDALTMAAAAARRALDAGGYDGGDVGFLVLGTTTPPMAEEDLTPRLGSFLGVPAAATTRTLTGSTRAGAQALADAFGATGDGGSDGDGSLALAVAADCPRGAPDSEQEHAAGAGAAAFVVAPGGPARVTDRAEHAEPYPGTRFRRAGSADVEGLGVTGYDREAFRTALSGAVGGLAADPDDADAAAVQAPDGKRPYRVAGDLGVDAERVRAAATVHELGDTGAASAPLGLARALADGADATLVAAFGSGAGATALRVERGGAVSADLALDGDVDLSYPEYLRRRGEISSGAPEGGGAYVSVPSWQRTVAQRHRLVAGRCAACDALNFPPEGACRNCGALGEYEPTRLAGGGTVEAATTIAAGGAPPEFAAQQARGGAYASAIATFEAADGGGAVSVPLQVVLAGEEAVGVGDRVRTAVRRIYEQEGVIRYGLKGVPADVTR